MSKPGLKTIRHNKLFQFLKHLKHFNNKIMFLNINFFRIKNIIAIFFFCIIHLLANTHYFKIGSM